MRVQIDWLTLNLKGDPEIGYSDTEFYKKQYIHIKKTDRHTRVFEKHCEVMYKGSKIGEFVYCPYSTAIKPDLVQFKLENYLLYDPNLFKVIDQVLQSFKLTITSISRLDLCNDFNLFYNDLHPQDFIRSFVMGDYIKCGRGAFQGKINPKKKKKKELKEDDELITFEGKKGKKLHEFGTLRIGTHSSEKQVYLYNKTQEMKAKTFKNWIHKQWVMDQMDVTDVWRLEVSLKLSNPNLLDEQTGEITKIDYKFIQSLENITRLYHSILNSNFHFKYQDKQKNITRKKDVKIFDEQDFTIVEKVVKIPEKRFNNRSDKIFLKKIHNIQKELPKDIALHVLLFKREFIRSKSLENWFYSKVAEKTDIIDLDNLSNFSDVYKTSKGYAINFK